MPSLAGNEVKGSAGLVDELVRPNRDLLPSLWKHGSWITAFISIILAIIYLSQQFLVTGTVQDLAFVGALLLNSVIAGGFGVYLHGRSVPVFDVLPAIDRVTSIPETIFGSPIILAAGLCFSAVLSGWAFLLTPWPQPVLNELLCAFLFSVNLQIGMGIGALALFWTLSRKSIGLMKIRILNLSRPDIVEFLDLVSLTVLLVGALCTIAVLSLLFSRFDMNFAVMAFSAFSFLMVLASYFVPVLPLVLKLRRVKFQELDRIEKRIDLKYDGVGATGAPDQEDLERLLTFRDVVRRIHVLPPNGQVSFLTAVSAIVVAFLPSVIQYWTNLPQ